MGFIKKAVKFVVGGGLLGTLAKGIIGGKKKPPKLPGPVTRDDARDQMEEDDELRRRRGAAADLITGTRGAEASAGSVGRLVVGS